MRAALCLAAALALAACDAAGGSGPETRLTAGPNGTGFRVAVSGPTVLVSSGSRGAVAVFERADNGWDHAADLLPDGIPTGRDDRTGYGWAVAVDGGLAVVGAYLLDGQRGAAFVFERAPDGTWGPATRLQPEGIRPRSGTDGGSSFGSAVAVGGGRVFVGRPGDDAVDVFERSGDGWTLTGTVVNPEPERTRAFGRTLATDGQSLVTSAFESPEDPARPVANGVAFVFRPDGGPGGYALDGRLTSGLGYDDLECPGCSRRSDGLGTVDIDGDVVVAGAPGAGTGALSRGGTLVVFERGPGGWARVARLVAEETDRDDALGDDAVAVEGGVAVASSAGKRGPGVVYTFERSADGTWAEADAFAEHDGPQGGPVQQAFGLSLALDGGSLVVGAPYEDGERGATYVYRRSGRGWAR